MKKYDEQNLLETDKKDEKDKEKDKEIKEISKKETEIT